MGRSCQVSDKDFSKPLYPVKLVFSNHEKEGFQSSFSSFPFLSWRHHIDDVAIIIIRIGIGIIVAHHISTELVQIIVVIVDVVIHINDQG